MVARQSVGEALSFPEFAPDGARDVFLWLHFVPAHDVRRGPPFRVLKSWSPELLSTEYRAPSTECVCSCSCSFFLIAHGLNLHTRTHLRHTNIHTCMKLFCVGPPKPSAICRLTYLLNPFLNSVFRIQVSLFSLCFIRLWKVLKFWIGAPLKLPSASGITNHSTPTSMAHSHLTVGISHVCWASFEAQAERIRRNDLKCLYSMPATLSTPRIHGGNMSRKLVCRIYCIIEKIVSAPGAYYDFCSHHKWQTGVKVKGVFRWLLTETDVSVSFSLLIFSLPNHPIFCFSGTKTATVTTARTAPGTAGAAAWHTVALFMVITSQILQLFN